MRRLGSPSVADRERRSGPESDVVVHFPRRGEHHVVLLGEQVANESRERGRESRLGPQTPRIPAAARPSGFRAATCGRPSKGRLRLSRAWSDPPESKSPEAQGIGDHAERGQGIAAAAPIGDSRMPNADNARRLRSARRPHCKGRLRIDSTGCCASWLQTANLAHDAHQVDLVQGCAHGTDLSQHVDAVALLLEHAGGRDLGDSPLP